MTSKTVDEYINGLEDWQADVVAQVRQIILKAAPDATESIKWAQPVYESNGPFSYIKAFKNSVNFGFWRGVDIDDPDKLLEGNGEKMRHLKLSSAEDIRGDVFADYVKQAVKLNEAKGDPTKG